MGIRSSAYRVKGRRGRGLLAIGAFAAVTTAIAAVWALRGTTPLPPTPAPITAAGPPTAVEAPRASAPTADDEGERALRLPERVPARDRSAQSPPHAQREPGAAVRPQAAKPKPSPPSRASASAPRQVSPSPGPVSQPDPIRSGGPGRAVAATQDPAPTATAQRTNETLAAEGHTGLGRGPTTGAGREGESLGGSVVGRGPAPASGDDDGRTGGATGSVPRAIPEPAQLVPPRVITSAGTAYPVEAFRLTVRREDLGSSLAVEGAEGTVRVRALVRADGTPDAVEVMASSGSAVLDRAATEAVRRWLFAPATRNRVPLDAYVTVTIRYVVR